MIDYNIRREFEETIDHLVRRVCKGKSNDDSWDDIRNFLNKLTGEHKSETHWRKGIKRENYTFPDNDYYYSDEENEYEQNKKLLEEIRKERKKIQTLNVERNRIDRIEARQELFYEYVGSVIESLPVPNFNPIDTIKNKEEYVLTIADMHYGATFKSANNEYSKDIASKRLEYLAGEIIEFCKDKNLDKIHIVSLGDIIQGILRITDLQLNDSSVVKSIVEVSRLIALFLSSISKYVYVEYYHVTSANHTQLRPIGTKANQLCDEDFEYIIGNYINDLCSNNERIKINMIPVGVEGIKIPIFNYNIIAMHGHQFKNLNTAVDNLSRVMQEKIDYLLLGHFHNDKVISVGESSYNNVECLVSPSFIGSDPYADKLMLGGKASVNIYGFNEKYGHDETYKIILN